MELSGLSCIAERLPTHWFEILGVCRMMSVPLATGRLRESDGGDGVDDGCACGAGNEPERKEVGGRWVGRKILRRVNAVKAGMQCERDVR